MLSAAVTTSRAPAAVLEVIQSNVFRCSLPRMPLLHEPKHVLRRQAWSTGNGHRAGILPRKLYHTHENLAHRFPIARAALDALVAEEQDMQIDIQLQHISQEQSAAASVSSSERAESRSSGPPATSSGQQAEYCIINFYHLTDVAHPFKTLREHQKWMLGRDIQGRIYISAQGINAQYSGLKGDALAYAHWVSQQHGFEELQWMAEDCEGHLFPKLRLKIRPNLVQLAGGTRSLPITDPKARATPLSPSQWQEMLRTAVAPKTTAATAATAGGTSPGGPAAGGNAQEVVVLDVRNAYEWDAGHFVGAQRPLEDHFNETPTDASGDAELPAYLQGVSPDAPVMMYCTGGIRCDIYSTYLRRKGFNNLYTLEKGVHAYLKEKGEDDLWNGSLFVFDARMAVGPGNSEGTAGRQLPAAAPCEMCGGGAELPHANCANIDCNKLFLACPACKAKHGGCCCEECTRTSRLIRPPNAGGNYARWLEAATEDLRGDHGGEAPSEAARQEELRRRQAALARRIAEGRGDGRARRRLARKERMAERMAAEKAAHSARRRLKQEAVRAQRERQAAEEADSQAAADLAARLAEMRMRRERQQQLAEAA